ncbi:MAG: AbrB/MazE/SpoVT family DNA-binding domain-containing protein [Chloroflexi bacterium]|nr:AbrB/MazE/SpoVT family DNA-binding domain-containing protein [Chloroflexota bacterium]
MHCCKVEALIPVDARGQIVLPKDLREKAGIKAGDKLAVVSFESGGQVCCFALVKADALADTVRDMLGPIMKEVL